MSTISVTLSANAGTAIFVGGHRIWVDALHERKEPRFSTLTPALQQRLLQTEAFFDPDYICYTHCHPDHYSQKLTRAAKALWPRAKLFLPEKEFADQLLVTGEEYTFEGQGIALRFIRLPHEGSQYADVKHYGLIISGAGCNILCTGDCATASPVLSEAVGNMPIDLAILDFPWITLAKGREFLKQKLRPKHVLACHLPFAQDDISGYRSSARRSVEMLAGEMDLRLLCDPLQTEQINI